MTDSRDKGKRGELELAKKLESLFNVPCRRTQQYCGTEGASDVVGLPGVHIESKRSERLNVYKYIEQAVRDSDGSIPMVCCRSSRKPWLAIIRLDDLPEFVVQAYLTLASEGNETL